MQREKRTNKKLKKLSKLEETSKDLAARVEQYDADAKGLEEREGDLSKEQTIPDRRENALLGQNRRFDIREGVIERAELDSVLRQLGEKRGLLDKMPGKSKGAATP